MTMTARTTARTIREYATPRRVRGYRDRIRLIAAIESESHRLDRIMAELAKGGDADVLSRSMQASIMRRAELIAAM